MIDGTKMVTKVSNYKLTYVANNPPQWSLNWNDHSSVSPIVVKMQTTSFVKLHMTDPELDEIIVSITSGPSFVSVQGSVVTINPTALTDFGTFKITFKIQDIYGNIAVDTKDLYVNVPNEPPFFVDGLGPQDVEVIINKVTEIPFPLIKDPEMQPITVTHLVLPSFVTFEQMKYIIEPISIQGKHYVQGTFTDGGYILSFSFYIYVINRVPSFVTPLREQSITLYS